MEIDVGVLSTEGVIKPVHHIGDLGSGDVVAIVQKTPGEREEPEAEKLLEDVDHLWEIHLTAPDGEGDSQHLEVLQAGEFSDLLWGEASVAQHSLGLDLQK